MGAAVGQRDGGGTGAPTAALPIEEGEDEEEESLLTIEIEDGDFADSYVTFNLMGLETDSPLLRIGTKMYEGRFEYVIHASILQSQRITGRHCWVRGPGGCG